MGRALRARDIAADVLAAFRRDRELSPMPATGFDVASARAAAAAAAAAARGQDKRAYVRRLFSEIAPRYDLLNHVLSFNMDRLWRRAAVREIGVEREPAGTYLDLCAGTLDLARGIASLKEFRGRVIGVDFAEPMLRAGRGKLRPAQGGAVAGDALELPLRAGSIAGSAVAFGIRNVTDIEACAREVERVLVPGGRFVVLEFSTPRVPVIGSVYRAYFHRILPRIGRVISRHPAAYTYLPESVDHFPEGDELARLLRRAGFSDVRWRKLTFGVAALHVAVKRGIKA